MNDPRSAGVVLLSGGSSGIGRHVAILLARRGVHVLAGVRRREDAESLRAESERIEPVYLDVAEPASVESVAAEIEQRFPRGISGLINNAGIAIAGPLELVDLDRWKDQYEVNVFGLVRLTQTLLPNLRRQPGRILNIGSAASHLALPMMAPYSSSKGAVDLLSDALRRELQPSGIRVVVIHPGQTATPIYSKSEQEAEERLEGTRQPEGYDYLPAMRLFQDRMKESVGLRASPEKVAAKIVRIFFAKRPRRRYHIGWDAKLSLVVDHFVPPWLVDWVIERRLQPKDNWTE